MRHEVLLECRSGLLGIERVRLRLSFSLPQVEHDPPDSECLLPSNQE